MSEIIIRNVNEGDIPFVADIKISGWKSAYKGIIDDKFLNSMDKKSTIEKLKKSYRDAGFIVAVENSEIVGFSRFIYNNQFTPEMTDIDCELMAIYVRPDKKNNGIGKAMFEYVVNEFKRNEKFGMIVWCLKENLPSKKFYESMGGAIVGEHNVCIGEKEYPEVGFLYILK